MNVDNASTLIFVENTLVPDDAAPYPTLRNSNVALCDNPRNPRDFATELESQYSLIQALLDCFVDPPVGSSPQSLPSVHAQTYAPVHIASSLSGDCRQLAAPPPPHPVASLLPPVPFSPCCAPAPPPNTASSGDSIVPFPPPLSNLSGTPKLRDPGGTSTPHGHEVPVPLGSPITRKLAHRRAVRRLGPYPISSASSSSQSGDTPSPPPTSPHSSTSSSTGSLPASSASGLKVSQRRNIRVDTSATPAQGSRSGAGGKTIPEWMRTQQCPHCGADWSTRRRPDFQRHVDTHTRDDAHFACVGVPIHLAAAYGLDLVDVMRIVEKGDALLYDGQLMVGGCKCPFSRVDALKRHLDNPQITCIGTHTANWLIGNKKKLKQGE